MGNPFGVSKHDEGGGTIRLAVTGDLDENTSEGLTSLIVNAVGQAGVTEVVVDLEHVGFLAASGVRTLLEGRDATVRHGCGFRVVNAFGMVCRVLTTTAAVEILQAAPAGEPFRARAGG